MKLRNKLDEKIYRVKSEDCDDCIRIFAISLEEGGTNFVMHYRSLAEFCEEWEDA